MIDEVWKGRGVEIIGDHEVLASGLLDKTYGAVLRREDFRQILLDQEKLRCKRRKKMEQSNKQEQKTGFARRMRAESREKL